MEWLRVKQIEMSLWRLSIISTVTLLTFVTSSFESMSQNDYRYMSYHDLLTTASRYYDQNVTTYSRFHFDESKNLMFVGARDRIYRFSLQLDLMQTTSWEVPIEAANTCLLKGQSDIDCRNYIMSIHAVNNRLFVCGSYAFSPRCSWRKTDTLEMIKDENGAGKCPFSPRSNITTLVTGDGKMFIGSTIDFSGSDSVVARIPLRADHQATDNSKILRTRQYNDLELFSPQFVGSFEHGEFIYFVFREASIEMASFGEKAIYSRIGRVCKNDSGGFHYYKDNWTSFLKARLNCSLSGAESPFYFDEVQDITFMPSENELYATFSTPDNAIQGSAICVFKMSTIEEAFNGPVKYQVSHGSPVWQQMEIENRDQFECRSSQRPSHFDTSKYQLMARSVQQSTPDPLYVEKLEKFTHIAVTKVATKLHENVKIIFVANRDGFIKKVTVLPRTKQSCLIEVLEPEYVGIQIETMKFIKSTESLYVGTKESIMKIPSQHCSRHVSKVSCINSMDPYCGWNDLTLTCGMAPNGNSLTTYWYQNATTCPILSSPVDGAWSSWSNWFKCAKSDPSGAYSETDLAKGDVDTCLCRTRTCDNPAPKYGGKKCEGHSIMVTNCTEHGGWSDWSSYGPCSQTCGVAIKVRRRTCSNPAPKHNGRLCIGSNQQEIYCTDLPPCPTTNINMQIDGGWSEWNEWSPCSAPCDGGFRVRRRSCNNPSPQNNGLECIGCNLEYEECNKQPCNEVKKLTSWTNWLVSNSSENGLYFEKRYRYMCKAQIRDPADLKIQLYKEETRACSANDAKCRRVNVTCEPTTCDPPRDCTELVEEEARKCKNAFQSDAPPRVASASLEFHWIAITSMVFALVCIIATFLTTKWFVERKIHRLRSIQGSPHYLSSYPNQYSSLPTKDYSENNKPKRQPSFSGTSTMGRSKVTNGTLSKSNNNLMNQNTPKILKYQNDTEMSTLKRNSHALNNLRLKQIEDDKDKY